MLSQKILSYLPRPMADGVRNVVGYTLWSRRNFAAPSPGQVKRKVLLRNGIPGATWIETGTFLGETTIFLARQFPKVISLEPSLELWKQARQRCAAFPNIELVNDRSENVFPKLLPTLSGDLNFWLDGHYSAGATHRGPKDTPIVEELMAIESSLDRLGRLAVLVDDVRCFDPSNPEFDGYPERNLLVDWANRNRLNWSIEHDIFIARR